MTSVVVETQALKFVEVVVVNCIGEGEEIWQGAAAVIVSEETRHRIPWSMVE